MIEFKNLVKDYADDGSLTRALRNVSFSIKKGEFVAVMGPSGSGKSTLLHILSFLDRPTGGSYVFQRKEMNEYSDTELARIRNKEMGFVFQAFNLLLHSSVYENVELPLLYTSEIPPEKREEIVRDAVRSVDLEEKLFVEAGKLSGGQRQRVAIARALVTGPSIIFADEPTGNLDSQSGAQVMEILSKLNKSGKTVILVTHETYTAEFAERTLRLHDGELVADERRDSKRATRDQFFK